jgi:hypothetical protein
MAPDSTTAVMTSVRMLAGKDSIDVIEKVKV